MKNFTTCICIMGLSGTAFGTVLMDQIGPDDGSNVGANITGCQDFEAAYDIYDIATMDNFTGAGENIAVVEMCLNGWNGFVDPSSVHGYTANLYSTPGAAALDLTGDIDSSYADAADATQSPTWAGAGFVISMPTVMVAAAGDNWVAMIPGNDFATGGQTGCADALVGDGVMGWQANPGGGFAMPGNMQEMTNEAAYRVFSGDTADPCDFPLPTECTADVDGDMIIAVGDVLAVVGAIGECGDGTYRPAADVAPLPNGDCCVDVSDLLAVIGAWGDDCTPRGACCSEDGTVCSDNMTQADCEASGSTYKGDNSMCSDIVCPGPYGGCPDGADTDCDDCWVDGDDATTDCNGGLNGDGSMDLLTIGVPLCGESSVYLDISGGTYRDTDWFECNALNSGGNFTVTCETEGPSILFAIVNLDTSDFVEYVIATPGQVVTHDFAPLTPGNYCFWAGASEWNTDWSCANGANYWMQLDTDGAASGACCVSETCVGEMSMSDCAAQNGTWHFNQTCAEVNDCMPIIGACCLPDQVCLENLDSDQCVLYGGTFAGDFTDCSMTDICAGCEGEEVAGPDEVWTAGTSDAGSGYLRAADLAGRNPSDSTVTIYGLALAYNGSWGAAVDPAGMLMSLDVMDASYTSMGTYAGTYSSTDIVYANLYDLHSWTFDVGSVTGAAFLSAYSSSGGQGEDWFLWMNSLTGSSYLNDGTGWVPETFGLNFCID